MTEQLPVGRDEFKERAFFLLERRRLEEARRLLYAALREYPDDEDLLFYAAQAEWLDDHDEEAELLTRQGLALAPDSFLLRRLLAGILAESNRLADAEQVLIGLIKDYPESADLYGRYARVTLKALDIEKAERLSTEGLRHDPEDGGCLVVKALCAIARGDRRQEELTANLVRTHPEAVSTAQTLIVALSQRGRNRDALRISRELLRSDPANKHFASLTSRLQMASHWSLIPMYPMRRWGWGGSIGLYLIFMVLIQGTARRNPDASGVIAMIFIVYVAYTWVWPRLLRRLLKVEET